MTVPYVQKAFYFLFSMPYDQGSAQWVSDIGTEATDLSYPLILPSWFPRKSLLCHVFAGGGLKAAPIGPLEVWMLVDPGGLNYKSGNPPGAEVWETITRCITLLQVNVGGGQLLQDFAKRKIDPPVPFNRDAGDKLWFGLASNDTLGWAYFNLGFMVPNTFQPTAVS
jgi:hypothetical protein